jgi:D-sedoheptulose 7-phosphate isomerase
VAQRRGVEEVFAHQLRVLGRPGDIALGISADGNCANVLRGLASARAAGMLTVALVGGDGGAAARPDASDHVLVVHSEDPRIVKEGHVTAYHVLWELVHVFLDTPAALQPAAGPPEPGGVEALYPFLYAGATDPDRVLRDVETSTREKIEEIVALRSSVGAQERDRLADCIADLTAAFAGGGTLLAFGNGGSSTDSDDVVHTFLDPAGDDAEPLPALCLTSDAAVVTALSNDVGFDVVFARQLRAFGRRGDVALGVSTSGGSSNVLAAFDEADRMGMVTVGLSGSGGGRMAGLASLRHLFTVPSSSVHRVQEVQTTLYHVLWEVTSDALAVRPGRAPLPPPAGRG